MPTCPEERLGVQPKKSTTQRRGGSGARSPLTWNWTGAVSTPLAGRLPVGRSRVSDCQTRAAHGGTTGRHLQVIKDGMTSDIVGFIGENGTLSLRREIGKNETLAETTNATRRQMTRGRLGRPLCNLGGEQREISNRR